MTLEEIQRRLSEVRSGLEHLAAQDSLDEQRSAEFDWLFAEDEYLTELEDEEVRRQEEETRREERRQDVLRRGQRGGRGVEPGSDPGPAQVRRDDPFDLDSIRVNPLADPEQVVGELRSRALSAVEQIRTVDDDHAARITELLERHDGQGNLARRVLRCGSETYERAFSHYLAGRPLVGDEARALSVGVDTEGGFAVPVALDPTLILTSDGSVNPLRQIARVETITTKEWQGVTSSGVTVTRKAEGAEATDDAPSIDQPTVTPQRVDAFIPFTYEVDQDWAQLRAEMTRLIQEGKDDEEATSFVTGDGVGTNAGGVVGTLAAASKFESATANTFASADVYELDNRLPERFRARARALANKVIYNDVRQFASADGHDLWARIGDGRPPQILGYPAHESTAMDSDSTVSLAEILLLGDFRHFLIVDRVGMSVELVPHLFGANNRPTGQRGIFAFWRNNSAVLADEAFRLLQVNDGV